MRKLPPSMRTAPSLARTIQAMRRLRGSRAATPPAPRPMSHRESL
jgi:hypothetical protein